MNSQTITMQVTTIETPSQIVIELFTSLSIKKRNSYNCMQNNAVAIINNMSIFFFIVLKKAAMEIAAIRLCSSRTETFNQIKNWSYVLAGTQTYYSHKGWLRQKRLLAKRGRWNGKNLRWVTTSSISCLRKSDTRRQRGSAFYLFVLLLPQSNRFYWALRCRICEPW